MTNDEYFNDKPMKEAIAKWRLDCANGYNGGVVDWLNAPYINLEKGKIVRGVFYSHAEIDEKIRQMEALMVTGYLLEWKDEKTGEWFGSEFEPVNGSGSNKYVISESIADDWFDNEVEVGFFVELGDTWLGTSDDWDFRLGVSFDSDKTPTEDPREDGVWEGEAHGECRDDGAPWRVRKVTIKGTLSDKAKAFIRRNPDVCFDYAR